MSNEHVPHGSDFERRLDLLVDGELPEAERRRLLQSLDRQPDGWKRCALAFLEAQCWRLEAEALAGEIAPPRKPSVMPTRQPSSVPQRKSGTKNAIDAWRLWRGRWIGTAASLLVVFVVGMGVGRWLAWGSHGTQRQIARPAPPKKARSSVEILQGPGASATRRLAHNQRAGGRSRNIVGPEADEQTGRFADAQQEPQSPEVAAATTPNMAGRRATTLDWELVGVPVSFDDRTEMVSIPARRASQLDRGWPANLPPAIPSRVARQLLQAGHQIHFRRHVLPIEMDDGRRLLVPVEDYEIRFVGTAGYQ